VTSIGHRRKLLDAIALLQMGAGAGGAEPPVTAAPWAAGAERRQLTVLFCDLVGSTALAARLDLEDLRDVMRAYQAACADVICGFEGHVAKYLGDGVLAYFGWPKVHEDDAERAERAGLELAGTIARMQPKGDVRLQARVGIATGQVVVGDLMGEGAARKEAVVGSRPSRTSASSPVLAPSRDEPFASGGRAAGARRRLRAA
jgi:class 3 adenylate cyclase